MIDRPSGTPLVNVRQYWMPAGVFVSTAGHGGGQEYTIFASMSTLVYREIIYVPFGFKHAFVQLSKLDASSTKFTMVRSLQRELFKLNTHQHVLFLGSPFEGEGGWNVGVAWCYSSSVRMHDEHDGCIDLT